MPQPPTIPLPQADQLALMDAMVLCYTGAMIADTERTILNRLSMAGQIPGPRGLPLLGNLLDVDFEVPLAGIERLADQYGPIYQMTIRGKRQVVCSSAALMEELTDEKRFVKVPPGAITEVDGPRGLFAATNEDPDWHQAHRILMPSFSTMAVQGMFDGMKDIANQLILSWARKGPENVINAPKDFTKLTLDTIALCTMDYRFNSFYQDTMHPFIDAMVKVLVENGNRSTRPGFLNKVMLRKEKEHAERRLYLRKVGLDIVENRRQNPKEGKDVLNTMIYGKDPKTGQVMRDELISEQMLTFLIAGHETTSGLLSFAFAEMLRNPETYFKAQAEVDRVVGQRAIQFEDIKDLHYLNAEASIVTLDGYVVKPEDRIIVMLAKAQRDPKVWGDDADQFKPDRMLDENFERISAQFPGSWKPFGNGRRACIGRPFAWQEALLVTAMVLQSFDVKLEDPSYNIPVKQTLTLKPDNFKIRVAPRDGQTATDVDQFIHTGKATTTNKDTRSNGAAASNGTVRRPLKILYGSNTGTCQALAQRAASDAASLGFAAEISDMDSATGPMSSKNGPVVIFTSSYEGEPPDNAARFIEWLQTCSNTSLSGVEFAVFGCGHRDWVRTLHRIPKLTDELMARAGGKRMAQAGFTDVAKGNVYGDFEEWLDATLWPALRSTGSVDSDEGLPGLDFELSTDARATALRFDVQPATVKANNRLTSGTEPEKYHLEINLPSNTTYECGDYLAILPQNSDLAVKEAMSIFNLPWDSVITLKGNGPSCIPLNTPMPVSEILRSYVELSQPCTKKTIRLLASHSHDSHVRNHLSSLAANDALYTAEITKKRVSLLHLYAQYSTSIALPIGTFLSLLPPLQVRQYSISSSQLAHQGTCTLTYGVLDTTSLIDPTLRFQGVTSNYLRSLQRGDTIHVAVRPAAKKSFRLPLDIESTPMLMFAAGTGLAPFRGFCQQRAILAASGRKLAPAMLFLGCRSRTTDRLYAQEMDRWVADEVVDVRYAFSQESEWSAGCRYVKERVVKDQEEVRGLWRDGARVYLCGSRAFAEGVREAAGEIVRGLIREKADGTIRNEAALQEVDQRFKEMLVERVASDVFD
ncbi:uncharacterized protein AB675_184 [Cyphellophora attinorum]|uniref:Bifunctional cytochrome P450/NADPH--P450 reductase n=1 Tax=Cyphellophora attinorum TaxID=1664694 RepID=A0A0N1HLD6_9EURO|nr:uncharacterized protein AB675_184 [Phialophora attinorum]KPI37800.1 hypothetical protein AB675_184 [Phialophora attinorum]